MQQTLLALCALLVFSLYALNQHRSETGQELQAVGGEVELMAAERARSLLARITALPYDEADVALASGAQAERVRTDTDGLSTTLGPEAGETVFDDLDDWNGFAGTERVAWNGTDVAFEVRTRVRYVDPLTPADTSAAPTLAKEVVVDLREAGGAPAGRPPVSAVLRQVVTPAWTRRLR